MVNGIIYKYVSPSGKVYIGQTINEKARRSTFLNSAHIYAGPKINKAREAALELNVEANNITVVCQGKRNQAYDFIWKYRDEFEDIPMKIQIKSKKSSKLPVIEYTLDGVETRRWANMTLAALDLGYSLGNFSTYCNGRNNHEYKGFLYYRGDKDDLSSNLQTVSNE